MPQLHLPMFPNGVTHITSELAFEKKDGRITYFNGHMPVFTHAENDVATFRMITSQFCESGYAKQCDIVRAFGVTSISMKRAVSLYREKGTKGFYAPRVTRGAAVLNDTVVAEIEALLAEGGSVAQVAEKLKLKRNTLEKAIRAGKIRMPVKKRTQPRCLDSRQRAAGCQHQKRARRSRLLRPHGPRGDRYVGTAGGQLGATCRGNTAL
jgi:hypothetical protein